MLMRTPPEALIETRSLREQQRFPYNGWFAVVIRSQREQDAADAFRFANVAAYWPNYERLTALGRGLRRVTFAPIFPGLLFCPTADERMFWSAIQRIPYVLNLFRKEGGIPATLTNADIETIRRIEADANNPPSVTPIHTFKTGQKVRFIEGLMSPWPPGKIVRLAADGRISIEVYLMGRMVPIWALPHQIERM